MNGKSGLESGQLRHNFSQFALIGGGGVLYLRCYVL